MRGFKRCSECKDHSLDVSRTNMGWLCAACNVDVRTSNVKQQPVPERQEQDRYAQLAARHGL